MKHILREPQIPRVRFYLRNILYIKLSFLVLVLIRCEREIGGARTLAGWVPYCCFDVPGFSPPSFPLLVNDLKTIPEVLGAGSGRGGGGTWTLVELWSRDRRGGHDRG